MRTLTYEENQKVVAGRKTQRPSYYNASVGYDVVISLEMEAWLILTPLAVRARFATWLQELSSLTVRDTVMDELTTEYLADEAQNASARREAYDQLFQPYDAFRADLPVQGFEDVPDLSTLFQQSVMGLGRLTEQREESIFRDAMQFILKQIQEDVQGDGLTQSQRQRALRSWIPVLLAYGP